MRTEDSLSAQSNHNPIRRHVSFCLGLLVSVSHMENFGFHRMQLPNMSGNAPRALKFLSYGYEVHHIHG